MSEVLVEKRGAVQWITINREERRNAMNDAVVFGIMAGLTAATSDPDDPRGGADRRRRPRVLRRRGSVGGVGVVQVSITRKWAFRSCG